MKVKKFTTMLSNMLSLFRIYNFYKNAPCVKRARAPQSLVGLHRWSNQPLEKLDFSIPCCSILLTNSEYITLFEMPSILSELEPVKVWLKYIGPKPLCRKSWNFLSHVAFCSQIQNILLFLKHHEY